MSGLFCGTKGLMAVAGGAIGAVATLGFGRLAQMLRPTAVGAVREGYALKEWATGKFDVVKRSVDSLMEEAIQDYERKKETSADKSRMEKDLLEKIDKVIQERLSRIQAERTKEEELGGG